MVLISKLTKLLFIIVAVLTLLDAKEVNCKKELLSLSIESSVTTKDILQNISNYCSISLVIKDMLAKKQLDDELYGINIKDLSLQDILDLLLKDKDLYYSFEKNIIKISGLETKTFRIDYVNSTRNGNSSTDITLNGSSNTATTNTEGTSTSGTKISSTDEFMFWAEISSQISAIVNTNEDIYIAQKPIINQESGLVTITATKKQLQRTQEYIKTMMQRLHKQVLIDVNIMYVTLSDAQTTGIDWSQFLKSATIDFNLEKNDIETTFANTISGSFTLANIVNFLKTIGEVSSISNPKILTLNNQPALISAGEEIFYKLTSTTTTAGTTTTTGTDEQIESIFAGVLLDITPAITDNNDIILKINPSISALKNPNESLSGIREIPPDLLRKQLSSVVKLANGEKVILGGLIEKSNGVTTSRVPFFGSIPILGYAFRYEQIQVETKELVIIITPHIITNNANDISLENLGFLGVNNENNTTQR